MADHRREDESLGDSMKHLWSPPRWTSIRREERGQPASEPAAEEQDSRRALEEASFARSAKEATNARGGPAV